MPRIVSWGLYKPEINAIRQLIRQIELVELEDIPELLPTGDLLIVAGDPEIREEFVPWADWVKEQTGLYHSPSLVYGSEDLGHDQIDPEIFERTDEAIFWDDLSALERWLECPRIFQTRREAFEGLVDAEHLQNCSFCQYAVDQAETEIKRKEGKSK